MMNDEYLVDVPVLLIFFNRPDTLKKVFDVICKAKPSTLLLYQDGPRNQEDLKLIDECRTIVSNITWNCKVYKNYQTINNGVDPSGYIADKWAFSIVDKCIILEDDILPSVSFFAFCKEMLDKYENDERIMLITGINYEEESKNIESDYFFTQCTDSWGWATWKRVVDTWDINYSFLDDPNQLQAVKKFIKRNHLPNDSINVYRKHRATGIPHFETLLMSNQLVNNGLTIVPKKNMILNIGLSNGAHFKSGFKTLPKIYQKVFKMHLFEIKNIQHPKYIFDNVTYIRKNYYIKGWNMPIRKCFRKGLVLMKLIITLDFKNIKLLLKRN